MVHSPNGHFRTRIWLKRDGLSAMTLADVKAAGAKTQGTLSAIPREGWEEYSTEQLEEMGRSLLNNLSLATRSEERRAIRWRQKDVSAALESANVWISGFSASCGATTVTSLFAATGLEEHNSKPPGHWRRFW
jgi:hypothetical protein